MSLIDGLREKLRPLLDRGGLQRELDEEMAFHFEREFEAGLAAGLRPQEARRAARASMGGAFRPAEAVRGLWRGYELGGLGQEVRLAIRRLRRRSGFTIVAATTLALGIGANTAIFSLIRGVLIRPLPYVEPDQIGFVWNPDRDTETWLSARELLEYRTALESFEELAAYTDFEVSLTEDAEPERVLAAATTANTFAVLGTQPLHGRLFQPEDDLPGASLTVLLSHELWQRRYGGDLSVVGRNITTDGESATVIGVLPPGFRLPLDYHLERPTELFGPSGIDETADLSWGNRGWFIFGRLTEETTAEAASAEVGTVGARWTREGFLDESVGGLDRRVIPLDDLLLADMRTPLLLLMGAVGLILLIACANVAHLSLARSEGRRSEIAIAAALGAGRGRLARQHLIENGLLALLGAVLGVGLAVIGLRVALAVSPTALIRMRGVGLDGTVLLFAGVLTIGTTMIAGLLPALGLSGVPLTEAMGNVRGSDRAGGRAPMRRFLVAVESALAVVLVIGAALLGRSFSELSQVDVGFDSSNVLVGGLTIPAASYPDAAQVGTFLRDLTERLEQLPGVEAAGGVRKLPLGESIGSWTVTMEEPLPESHDNVEPDWQIVTPGYFRAMRVVLREGRFLTRDDRAGSRPVAVISETMSERYWQGESPLGKRFRLGSLQDQPMIEIVGVAAGVRHNDVLEDPRVEMYLSHDQWPELQRGGARRTMGLVVRTAGDPMALLPAVRRELATLDSSIPLANPRPMSLVTGGALAEERFTAGVFGVFAGLALALAAIGLYGVTAYTTSRRTNELGIRLALGAGRFGVAGMVVREALMTAGLGVVAGSVAAAWLTRFLTSQLYGVSPLDVGTFVTVPLVLLAVSGLAAYLPARRAARIDPVLALRSEG